MKRLLFFFALGVTVSFKMYSQAVKVFAENGPGGLVLYATNTDLCPVSVLLKTDLTNMTFSEAGKTIFIVPPRSEKYKLGEFTVAGNGKAKYSYEYKTALGDVTLKTYDPSFAYDLPFQKAKSFSVAQGYNGSLSHQNENALDFNMPEGSEVLAAREGTVVQVVQNSTESCPREECKKYNNYVTVLHSDGTFSHYAHIKYNGAKVKVGDAVKKGDVIAYSGNVGWSVGPHLHFVCFLPGFDKWQTIPTKFRNGGDKVTSLQEGSTYLRNY